MSVERMPAVILAGAKAGDALATAAGVAYKALAPVRGQAMVTTIATALSGTEAISEVFLVGPGEVAAAAPSAKPVPDAGSFFGNLKAGVSACGNNPHCLVITCDIPFITPTVLDAFIAAALARDADLAYPIVDVALCYQRFPGMRRTSIRLREGRYTGGNAVVMRPSFLERNAAHIEGAYEARKKPLQLVGMVGWDLLPRLLLSGRLPGLLPLHLLEERVGRLVGGSVAAVQLPYPEIGTDFDKPDDLRAAL